MKLIDKEALLLELKKKRYSKQSLDLIESQPVVDAIPVDFIENWLNSFMKEINGRTYYMGDGYDSADDLLEAWRKDNETDRP